MMISTKTTIKSYFETGDRPTQSQFSDFIDSCLFQAETSAQSVNSLNVIGTLSAVNINATTVSAATAALTNITATNITATSANVTNQVSTTITAASANISNLNSSNITAASLIATNASLGQLTVLTSANITNANLIGTAIAPTQAINDASTKIATTAFANPAVSLATPGYVKLPSGVIFQWGKTGNVAATNTVTVTFPIQFQNNIWGVQFAVGTAVANNCPNVQAISTSAVTIGNPGGSTTQFYWLAYGN